MEVKRFVSFVIAVALAKGVHSELVTWIVTDENNETCSLMEMDAVIIHPVDPSLRVEIPEDAEVPQYQTCPTDETIFSLTWNDAGYRWQINFNFTTSSESYTLERYTGSVNPLTEDGYPARTWDYKEQSYPTVAIGNSFACSFFVAVGARLSDVRWQPFANLNEGQFGPGEECPKGLSSGESFATFLVAVVAILLSIFVAVFSNPRRK